MSTLRLVLRIAAAVFIVVAGLHLSFGLDADRMLGAVVPAATVAEPSLDSQNRFYGVAFSLYGVLLYLCAGDLHRYAPILQATFTVFFLAGLARLVSWSVRGAPAPAVIGLMVTELVLPPLLYLWLRRDLRAP